MADDENDRDNSASDHSDFLGAELQDRFNEIDSEIDAIRSSILDDDDGDDSGQSENKDVVKYSSDHAALAEDAAAEMERVVQSLREEQEQPEDYGEANESSPHAQDTTNRQPPSPESSFQPSSHLENEKTIKSFHLKASVTILIAAILVGMKLNSASTAVEDTSLPEATTPTKGGKIHQRRKVERCRTVNGERYCESQEESTTTTSEDDWNGNPKRRATFQKCRYVNGESYCESFEQSVSSGDDETKPEKFQKAGLAAEFKQADTNRDGKVSQPEFLRYKGMYLQQNPHVSAKSFARFDEFDVDSNGYISVEEHEGYYRNLGLL